MKKIFLALTGVLMLAGCGKKASVANYNVVPLPNEIVLDADAKGFTMNGSTAIVYPAGNEALESNAKLMAEYVEALTGLDLKVTDQYKEKNAILLSDTLAEDNAEAYKVTVNDRLITIDGGSAAGNFYGIQMLRKAIDATVKGDVLFPAGVISAAPRFAYRGAHFDTARHFFPVDSVKEFIDMIALHGMNRMHWHISDDQGWRLEIKKYPKLISVGSKRSGTCVGHDFEKSDSVEYGGYYTQDEAREIVDYAARRHITVIPEIDLPGHMVAALTAYPELGCTGGPYEVWQRWGVSEDLLCAGNDSTLTFIDDVLNEVMDVFPSEYIHVGGDECPKVRWEACEKCQKRIKELGLKSDSHSTAEQKLQTFVMDHAAKTLASKGRKMIGWDEIIEGGLPEGATVMSWRGTEGAQQAAELGHDAILTPTNYCYFDYAQSQNPEREPLGIGGFVPVEKVYSFEPTDGVAEANKKHILGAQANLWTEYISTMSHVQYMELPRLAALSEVLWRDADNKDYREFAGRLPWLINTYRKLGYNYAPHVFDVQGGLEPDYSQHNIVARLYTLDDAPIYYTLDGTEPSENSLRYDSAVALNESCVFKAVAVRPEGNSYVFVDSVKIKMSTGSPVELLTEPHSRYKSIGSKLLTDGRMGSMAFNTGEWIGFEGVPLVAVIDLGSEKTVSTVWLRTLVDTANWIFDTRGLKVWLSSDGKTFEEVASEAWPVMDGHVSEIRTHVLKFSPKETRYVKVEALCETSLPKWHGIGYQKPGFLFVDEIVVE